MTELEGRVLSGLFNADTRGTVLSELERDDLTDEIAQNAFTAVQELFSEDSPIEPLTVSRKLSQIYGDVTEIDKMCRYYALQSPTSLDYCIKTLQDASRLRRIKDLTVKLTFAESLPDAEKLISELSLLSAPRTGGTFETAQQAATAFMDSLNSRVEKGVEFVKWGIYPLDCSMHMRRGNFIVIGARPSTGKSALALQSALKMAKAGYRVGVVSMEMGSEEVNERCIAHLSAVPLDKIARGKLQDTDFKRVWSACEYLYKLPIGFDYSARTVTQIQARALSERWEVVFVDYLQLMNDSGKGTRYEVVTAISQGLQQLAHRNNILVFALSQLSRPQKTADGQERRPTLTDLRESGQVEQDADAVILLSLSDSKDKTSDRYIQLAKNRQGRCCDFSMSFNGDTQTFEYRSKS